MMTPAQYRYDPPWQFVAFSWTVVAGFLIAVFGRVPPRGPSASPRAAPFAALGVLITLRRYAFPRTLVLDEDGVWLPSGFLP